MNKSSSGSYAERLANARRIVVKIGSALFVDQQTGALDRDWLEGVCADVAELRKAGKEVVIVSSGAVALGTRELGLDPRRARLEDSQAAAAAGQILLAHAYQEILGGFGLKAAQVLLTLDDSESRRRYLNASKTLLTLLNYGAVPVVNENDTVATQELRYGDNDRLAARVAQMVSAECLVLLSDVDGLYTADPRVDGNARYIDEVTELKREFWEMAGGPGSSHGSGGMRTKLDAARIAIGAGCRMCIASGRVKRPLSALASRWPGNLVSPERDAGRGPQAVDCRHVEAQRRRASGCRRRARPRVGAQPVAGRRDQRRRAIRARRRRARAGARWQRDRARPDCLFGRRGAGDRGLANRRVSPTSWDIAAGMRSSTATISSSSPRIDDGKRVSMSTAKRNAAPSLLEQMLELGRRARAAARDARAHSRKHEAGRAALCGRGNPRRERRDPARQCRGRCGREKPRSIRCARRSTCSRPEACRRYGRRRRSDRGVCGSDRRGDRAMAATERAHDRARARAARRDRHHLREPAECNRRRGRVVFEKRQRGDSARRLGKRPLESRDSSVSVRGACKARNARGGDTRWCRLRIAKPSASCCAT